MLGGRFSGAATLAALVAGSDFIRQITEPAPLPDLKPYREAGIKHHFRISGKPGKPGAKLARKAREGRITIRH